MLLGYPFSDPLPSASAPSAAATERRACARAAVEVDVTVGGAGRVLSGVSSNVSMGGLYVSTYLPLVEGSRASLRFRLPTGSVVATGVVRWTREARPGRIAGMGIEFLEMDAIDRENLRRFCGNRPRLLSYEEIVDLAR